MDKIIKKLNNFQFSSLLISLGAVVQLIVMVVSLILYQTSGITSSTDSSGSVTTSVTTAFHAQDKLILGMFYFICALLILILCVTVIARSLQFIFPKQKLVPQKSNFIILSAASLFSILLVIFNLLIVCGEECSHVPGFVIMIILGLLSSLYGLAWIAPFVRCRSYCPEVSKKTK